MKIIFLKGKKIEETRALYEEVFQDETSYTDYFFEKAEREGTAIVLKNEDGESMAQLFLLPKIWSQDEKLYEAFYVYGVCTREQFRRQGLMKKLMCEAEKYCRQEAADLMYLIPVDEKLYTGLGFVTVKKGEILDYELSGKEAGMMLKFNLEPVEEGGLTEEIYEEMNDLEEYIVERGQILPFRDREYFEDRIRLAKAENGGVYLLRKRNDYTIAGIIISGEENGEIVILDVIGEIDKKEGFIKDFMRWKGTAVMKEYLFTIMVKEINPALEIPGDGKLLVNEEV